MAHVVGNSKMSCCLCVEILEESVEILEESVEILRGVRRHRPEAGSILENDADGKG